MRKTIQNTIVLFLVMCIPNHSSEKKAKKKGQKKKRKMKSHTFIQTVILIRRDDF